MRPYIWIRVIRGILILSKSCFTSSEDSLHVRSQKEFDIFKNRNSVTPLSPHSSPLLTIGNQMIDQVAVRDTRSTVHGSFRICRNISRFGSDSPVRRTHHKQQLADIFMPATGMQNKSAGKKGQGCNASAPVPSPFPSNSCQASAPRNPC
jgi:hypothetical protein